MNYPYKVRYRIRRHKRTGGWYIMQLRYMHPEHPSWYDSRMLTGRDFSFEECRAYLRGLGW